MTRYYYPASRAHHAYCMAKDFGMEFERRFGKWTPEGLLNITQADYRIYIHPDSVHLLEYRANDLVEKDLLSKQCWFLLDPNERHFYEITKIIKRDGKAFHWPEVDKDRI
jgi:hypothetical protein